MLPLKPHISFSQFNTYNRCSWQYYLRYIKGIIERPKLATAGGRAGHDALAANYRKKVNSGHDIPLIELLDKYSDFYDNETAQIDPADLEPDEDVGATKDMGINTMKVYHAKFAPKIRPVLVEFEFNVDLSSTDYEEPLRIVNGRIDLITAAEEIFDNKFLTTRRPKQQLEVDSSPQLTLYEDVYHERFGRDARNVGFMSFIPPGQKITTVADVQILTRDPRLNTPSGKKSRRARLRHQLHTTERSIREGLFMPVDDPKTCSWCSYREMCQFNLVKDDYVASQIRQRTTPPEPEY